MLLTIELEVRQCPTVAQPEIGRVGRRDAIPVAGLPRLGEASDGTGRRVLDASRRRRLGCHLVEAGQRQVFAIRVEVLDARDAAVGSEGPELDELSLEGSATDAVGARKRPPPNERAGLPAENFVFVERGTRRGSEP